MYWSLEHPFILHIYDANQVNQQQIMKEKVHQAMNINQILIEMKL
jgi:hypothetical protein